MGWLSIPDKLPPAGGIGAIFCPSYCLTWKKTRLTAMSQACIIKALWMAEKMAGKNPHLILSNAYPGLSEKEAAFKIQLLLDAGFSLKRVRFFTGITNTFEEVVACKNILQELEADNLLVAEKYHMPRLLHCFKTLLPEITLYWASVSAKYEVAREPSLIKSIRAGFKPLWVAWNVLLHIATPLLLWHYARNRKNKK